MRFDNMSDAKRKLDSYGDAELRFAVNEAIGELIREIDHHPWSGPFPPITGTNVDDDGHLFTEAPE